MYCKPAKNIVLCKNSRYHTKLMNVLSIVTLSLLIVLIPYSVQSQNGNGNQRFSGALVTVNVTATFESSIQIETLSNINFGRISPGMTEIYINPRQDAEAGVMRITGQPNSLVRVSFIGRRELIRLGGGPQIFFNFEVSSAPVNDQLLSEPLTQENRQVMLSDNGEFYFWIGGSMDLRDLTHGQYEGEFTLEVDYI
jgi:hypothetical protein